jgi:hypothetical protein
LRAARWWGADDVAWGGPRGGVAWHRGGGVRGCWGGAPWGPRRRSGEDGGDTGKRERARENREEDGRQF